MQSFLCPRIIYVKGVFKNSAFMQRDDFYLQSIEKCNFQVLFKPSLKFRSFSNPSLNFEHTHKRLKVISIDSNFILFIFLKKITNSLIFLYNFPVSCIHGIGKNVLIYFIERFIINQKSKSKKTVIFLPHIRSITYDKPPSLCSTSFCGKIEREKFIFLCVVWNKINWKRRKNDNFGITENHKKCWICKLIEFFRESCLVLFLCVCIGEMCKSRRSDYGLSFKER